MVWRLAVAWLVLAQPTEAPPADPQPPADPALPAVVPPPPAVVPPPPAEVPSPPGDAPPPEDSPPPDDAPPPADTAPAEAAPPRTDAPPPADAAPAEAAPPPMDAVAADAEVRRLINRERRNIAMERGTRWRFAWSMLTYAYVQGGQLPGIGIGANGMAGVGYPVESSAHHREQHAFGYFGDISASAWGIARQKHRLGVAGLVGRDQALYYDAQAGIVLETLTTPWVGFSAESRIGVALGWTVPYVMAFGVGTEVFEYAGHRAVGTSLSITLVGVANP